MGNTLYAASAVLSAFMGGLALGSYGISKKIHLVKKPLTLYGFLEIAIGISGFGISLLLTPSSSVYLWFHEILRPFPEFIVVIRYLFSFVLLVVPTFLMGTTLPILSKFCVENKHAIGLRVGMLYALNTLGAAMGCFIAGFFLIGSLGLFMSTCCATFLCVLVGATALVLQRFYLEEKTGQEKESFAGVGQQQPKEQRDKKVVSHRGTLNMVILVAFAISGFIALAYEVIWTRVLILFIGNSVYAFSTMLTTCLVGMALGSLAVSTIVDKRKLLFTTFGLIEVAIGFYVFCVIFLARFNIPALVEFMIPGDNLIWDSTMLRFLKTFVLLLFPMFLFGATFPLVVRLYTTQLGAVGKKVGVLYTWNTCGAIGGAIIAGFLLLPQLGVEKSLVVFASLNLVVGMVLIIYEPLLIEKRKYPLLGGILFLVCVGMLTLPKNVFLNLEKALMKRGGLTLIDYKEDVSGAVAVCKEDEDNLKLFIDNLDVAGMNITYLTSHLSLAHFPMLLHDNPETVFVLGFGGGGTSYSIGTHQTVKTIDIAEINASVVDFAHYFHPINHNIVNDPRVSIHINDGRNYLLTTKKSYDVISVDLLYPQTSGTGSLYTKEFYQLCDKRLSSRGVMAQWLHPNAIPFSALKMIVRTAQTVFPHVSLWWSPGYVHLILINSKKPIYFDFAMLSSRMNEVSVKKDLSKISFTNPFTLCSYFIAADDDLVLLTEESNRINSDDLPLLEYQAPLMEGLQAENYLRIKTLAEVQQSIIPKLTNISDSQRDTMRLYEEMVALLYEARTAHHQGNMDHYHTTCSEAQKLLPSYLEMFTVCPNCLIE